MSTTSEKRGEGLSQDTIFGILQNSRRREVLQYLRSTGSTATIGQLTEIIAALENGVNPSELTYQQRKRVRTSLYQTHLPKLADEGLVEYDQREGTVSLTDSMNNYDIYFQVEPKETSFVVEGPRVIEPVSGALAAFSILIVLLAVLNVPPLSHIPPMALAALNATFLVIVSLLGSSTKR
jgi:hypothetical protein